LTFTVVSVGVNREKKDNPSHQRGKTPGIPFHNSAEKKGEKKKRIPPPDAEPGGVIGERLSSP